MGAVGKAKVDPDGRHIWAVVRCDAGPDRFGSECADSELDPILKFDPEGNVVESFGSGMFIWPHGIDVDASGNVLILGDGERLEEVQVKLMRRQDNEVIVRSRDLSGKEVIAQRTPVLGAGIKVKPIRLGEENKVAEVEMLELTEERRAKLISAIESNGYIPKSAKERIIGQLTQPKVPADVVARIESRMGG